MKKKDLYFGGVPMEPDVRKLREQYPEGRMKPGQVMSYDEVEAVLKVPKDSGRFYGVTNKWRKIVEEETGIILGVERGEGFKVLAEGEKVDLSGNKLRMAARAARRSYLIASRVDIKKLTDDDKARLDHYIVNSSKTLAAMQIKSTKLLPDLRVINKEVR